MKRIVVISLMTVFVLSLAAIAFTDSADTAPEWFNEMIKWRKEQVNEAVKDETITEEQAKYWNDHIEYMEEYHEENGFDFGPGACHGGGFGRSGRGFGTGGFGPGMMGGYWNNNVNPVQ